LPDDAFETVILPKDLGRACKVGEDFLQSRYGVVGVATVGYGVRLGLGSGFVTTHNVQGRLPPMDKGLPQQRPLVTFRVDPNVLVESLLAMVDLLPDDSRSLQCCGFGPAPAAVGLPFRKRTALAARRSGSELPSPRRTRPALPGQFQGAGSARDLAA